MKRKVYRVRWPSLLLTLILLAAAGFGGLALAAEQGRIDRQADELRLLVVGDVDVTQLLHAFRRTRPDLIVNLTEGDADPVQLARMLDRGEVDAVFLAGPYRVDGGAELDPALAARSVAGPFHAALVPVVRFPHPVYELSRDEARALLAATTGDQLELGPAVDPDCHPLVVQSPQQFLAAPAWNEISLVRPEQLEGRVQALAITGVEPTFNNLADGSYPLTRPLHVLARPAMRPLGLELSWPPRLRDRYDPNREALDGLVHFLSTPAAYQVFTGHGPPVTVAAVGDVMLGRAVGRVMAEEGMDYPYVFVQDRLQAADIAFANLESPLGTTGVPIPGKMIWFRADPAAADDLAATFDILTLANNHILDYDEKCLDETITLLTEHGIKFTGAGYDLEQALSPVVVEISGVRLAFLGFSDFAHIYWCHSYPRTFAATADRPGVAPADAPLVRDAVAAAREVADYVITAFHWGDEYVNYPNQDQIKMGRHAVSVGADVVLGAHPHSVQGFEFFEEGFIAYSLGNFIMDQRRQIQCESMILEIEFLPDRIRQIRVVPAWIEEHRPLILTGTAAAEALAKLRRISLPLSHR